jgi:hypothetical protein
MLKWDTGEHGLKVGVPCEYNVCPTDGEKWVAMYDDGSSSSGYLDNTFTIIRFEDVKIGECPNECKFDSEEAAKEICELHYLAGDKDC